MTLGVTRSMTPVTSKRGVLSVSVLGLAMASMLAVQAQAAERVVLAEYFTSIY
jgi:hypothetical protein